MGVAPHGTSVEMSGNVGTKKSDPPDEQMENMTNSDDQDQRRVRFDVGGDSTDVQTRLMESKTS